MSREFHKTQQCGWQVYHNIQNDPIIQLAKWPGAMVDINI